MIKNLIAENISNRSIEPFSDSKWTKAVWEFRMIILISIFRVVINCSDLELIDGIVTLKYFWKSVPNGHNNAFYAEKGHKYSWFPIWFDCINVTLHVSMVFPHGESNLANFEMPFIKSDRSIIEAFNNADRLKNTHCESIQSLASARALAFKPYVYAGILEPTSCNAY